MKNINSEIIKMNTEMYEGKAKVLYETDDNNILMKFKDDITAGDGEKHETMINKGSLNCTISKKIFEYLDTCRGIQTHYISSPNVNEQLVKKLHIIPVEVVIRNIAAGSICRRYNLRKGHKFKTPLLELFYKDDSLHDPLVNDSVVTEMGWCSHHQLSEIKRQAHIVHARMTEYWAEYDLTLVDQKFEFGIDAYGRIMLADEITPDSCRLWDTDGNSLDKDVFRQGTDMAKVSTVYNYIHDLIKADSIV
jgi:phosphoribosylaminoimidazole-succinocarboxamide synthase